MFIGYLTICIGLECKMFVKQFDTLEDCETEGSAITLYIEEEQPQVTTSNFLCRVVGEDAQCDIIATESGA